MKIELIMNGTIKLVLIPENDIDKSVLEAVSKTEIEASIIENHTQILDKVIQEGMIIGIKKTPL
jgi:hypothetical protein